MDTVYSPATLSGTSLNGENGSIKTFSGTFDSNTNQYDILHLFSTSGSYALYNASYNTGLYIDAATTP